MADPAETRAMYRIELLSDLDSLEGYSAVVGTVAHDAYCELTAEDLQRMLLPDGLLADVKGMWHDLELPAEMRRWKF